MTVSAFTPLALASSFIGTTMGALFFVAHFAPGLQFGAIAPSVATLFGETPPVFATITKGKASLTSERRDELETLLTDAFDARGIPMTISFKQGAEQAQATIVYTIGSSEIGPLPLYRAAEGVRPAVEAYRLSR